MWKKEFFEGRLFDAYRHMGAHKVEGGFRFTTFAPNAQKVSILGDFTNWQEAPMTADDGFYVYTTKTAAYGQLYKYRIYTGGGAWTEHTDPYAFQMELRPGCCAVIADLSYRFGDAEWMKRRTTGYDAPVNIYELHLGSWKQDPARPNGWYRYDEIADTLIAYLKKNHYTHVEFMPLMEHPFDGSWGYQTTGFFAPTSRYGEPKHLMRLIDKLHQAGLGAILDLVPVHFAIDAYGLRSYDGTALYEYPQSDVTESEWGSCNFIYSRREVQCFMQSAAGYWLGEYHFDGLRMDAVSRMIYWQGDEKRGENPNSLTFLKQMNLGLKKRYPTAMLIAEDSSAYPGVTKPVADGGLGFDYKWALGWMHDTLEYFQTAPEYRERDYHKLTFAMRYFHSERFLLELSHDENVHGKATVLQKMHGLYEDKFPQGRALYLFMAVHPGKKLQFMGGEWGQLREWDEARQQDWDILEYPIHDAFHQYMIALNRIYATKPELHQDYREGNFQWLDCRQSPDCIYAMGRFSTTRGLVAVFNFSNREKARYSVALPRCKNTRLLLHSDWQPFGGSTPKTQKTWSTATGKTGTALTLRIPPYSGMLFQTELSAGAKAAKR